MDTRSHSIRSLGPDTLALDQSFVEVAPLPCPLAHCGGGKSEALGGPFNVGSEKFTLGHGLDITVIYHRAQADTSHYRESVTPRYTAPHEGGAK